MSEQNKKKNPFSIYWIYAIIGVALIGFQLFSGSVGRIPVKFQSTFDHLAEQGYVTEVELINKVRVDFKLTIEGKEYVKKSNDKKLKTIKESLNNNSALRQSEPVYELTIVDAGNFESKVDEINKKIKEENTKLSTEDKETIPLLEFTTDEEINYIGSILQFLLPIGLMIVIWIFVMRRMSGGGGAGGAGGQIFNI